LKLWMLMTVVTLAALGLGAARFLGRVLLARQMASHHAAEEAEFRRIVEYHAKGVAYTERAMAYVDMHPHGTDSEPPGAFKGIIKDWKACRDDYRNGVEYFTKHLVYETRLRRKWERAARFPWPSVAPDPPEPE